MMKSIDRFEKFIQDYKKDVHEKTDNEFEKYLGGFISVVTLELIKEFKTQEKELEEKHGNNME